MTHIHKNILVISVFIVLAIIYAGLSLQNPRISIDAFDAGHLDNKEYGQKEDNFFGPFKSLISGMILLGLCLTYFKGASPWKLTTILLIYLLLTRFWVLFNPPYGESIIGHFSDATWLYRNSFNYIEYFRQPSFSAAGSGVLHYPTSIYPSFIAFLMWITPNVKSFLFVIHLCVFIFSSITITFFREILKKFVDDNLSIILAILLLSLPIYQSMTEVLNMEIPSLLTVILSIYFLLKRNIPMASVFAILSVLIKAPGGIVCAAVFAASLILFFIEPQNKNRIPNLFWGASTCIIAFIKAVLRSKIMGEAPRHNKISFLLGWDNIKQMPTLWIFLGLMIIFLIFSIIRQRKFQNQGGRLITEYFKTYYKELIIFAIASLWFLLYLNFSVMGPRYKLLLAPFFILSALVAFLFIIPHKKALKWIFVGFVLLAFLGSHGLYFGEDIKSSTYSYNELERSLEYRNDLMLHQQLAALLENKFTPFAVGAPFVTAQLLVMPEVGYVKKPLNVFIYGVMSTLPELKNFMGLDQLDIKKTIWVGSEDHHITDQIDFPIGKYDKIIQTLTIGNKEVHLFLGGFAIENMRRMVFLLRQKHRQKLLLQKLQQNNIK